MQWTAAILATLPSFAAAESGIIHVTGVRAWSYAETTRIIIDTSGPFVYRSDRAYNPDRLFIDIPDALPWIAGKRLATKEIGDRLVRRVRIAENAPHTTRIVFDLAAPAELTITRLDTPNRMVVELRALGQPHKEMKDPVVISSLPAISSPAAVPPPVVISPDVSKPFVNPPVVAPPVKTAVIPAAPPQIAAVVETPELPAEPDLSEIPAQTGSLQTGSGKPTKQLIVRGAASTDSTQVLPASHAPIAGAPKASQNAARSLTRALGLKVNRIVIDAGHGGHDDGTIGPHGVLEKDVVLDVALRLSKLVQERMGAEVVLTRSDDTFIPLHERTAIANEHKGDLFLSIHANSSPAPEVAGTETFFLNLAASPGATETAARENAGSDKSVGELRDLIQSITMNDKIEESHSFAENVQAAIQAQASRSNANAHNRGVKKAPFVVLIGASMPSVLAEIGFLSNSRDEANLGKPDYRQKVAEALYKGLSQYAQSLSHFDTPRQVAVK